MLNLINIFLLLYLSSCAFLTAMKDSVPLSKEDKIVLEEYYRKGKIKKESFICSGEKDSEEEYCGYYKTVNNLCMGKNITHKSCKSYSLGILLCMSLDSKIGFCGDVDTAQALCMLGGKSRPMCEGIDFKKALCVYEGGSLTYCDSLLKRAQSEDVLLQDKKEAKNKLKINRVEASLKSHY